MATTINTQIPKVTGSDEEDEAAGPRIPKADVAGLQAPPRQMVEPPYESQFDMDQGGVQQPPEPDIDPSMRTIDPRQHQIPGMEFLDQPENNMDTTRDPGERQAGGGGQLSIPQQPVRVAQARPPAGVMSDVPGIELAEPPEPPAPERLDDAYRLVQDRRDRANSLDWLMRQTGGYPQPPAPGQQPAASAPAASARPDAQDRPFANSPAAQRFGMANRTQAEIDATGQRGIDFWSAIGTDVGNIPSNGWNIIAGGPLRGIRGFLNLPSAPNLRDLAQTVDNAAFLLSQSAALAVGDRSGSGTGTSPTALRDLAEPLAQHLPESGVGSRILPEHGGPLSGIMATPEDSYSAAFLQGIAQFVTGYRVVGKVTGLDNKFLNSFRKATLTDFAAFEGSDKNFADLMAFFGVESEITNEWLRNKLPDHEFQARLQNTVAGGPLNIMLPGVFHLVARHRNKQVLQSLTGADSMDAAGQRLQDAGIDPSTLRTMINYGVREALEEAQIQPQEFRIMLAGIRPPMPRGGGGAARAGDVVPPPAGDAVRLYRGVGNNLGEADSSAFFTTDPAKAAKYGNVHYVDVPKSEMGNFIGGHGGADEYITDSTAIIARLQPLPRGGAARAPGAAVDEGAGDVLARLREGAQRLEERGGEAPQATTQDILERMRSAEESRPQPFGADELVRDIERRLPPRMDHGIGDHTFSRYMWDNISQGEWRETPPPDRSNPYRPTPRPSDARPADLDMVRLTNEETDLFMRAVQTRAAWYEEGAASGRGRSNVFTRHDPAAMDEARRAASSADAELRRRLGDGTASALIDDVMAKIRADQWVMPRNSYDQILRYVRERYGFEAADDAAPRLDNIRPNASGGDDWLEQHWQAIERRGTASEVSAYHRTDERTARASRPVPRTALQVKAEGLEGQLQRFENAADFKKLSHKEQAAAIRREFGFFVDPDDLRTGNVWWRVGKKGEIQGAVAGIGSDPLAAARTGGGKRTFWDSLDRDQRARLVEMWGNEDLKIRDMTAYLKELGHTVTERQLSNFAGRYRELFSDRKSISWTSELLKEFQELWHSGKSTAAIAESFGERGFRVSGGSLQRYVEQNRHLFDASKRDGSVGVRSRGSVVGRLSNEDYAKLSDMWKSHDVTIGEITEFLRKASGEKTANEHVLHAWANSHRDDFPLRGHNRLDWTEPRLAEAERLWRGGESADAIAKSLSDRGFPVNSATIRNLAASDRERFPRRESVSGGDDFRALLETPRIMALDDATAVKAVSEALGRQLVVSAVAAARKRYGLTLTAEERASLQEAVKIDKPTPNVLSGLTEEEATSALRTVLAEKGKFAIAPDVAARVLQTLEPVAGLVPEHIKVGVLVGAEPSSKYPGLYTATYQLADGQKYRLTMPGDNLFNSGWAQRPRSGTQNSPDFFFIGINRYTVPLAAEFEPAGLLGFGNPASQFQRSLRSGLAHEIVHNVLDDVDPVLKLRLVGHAERLRVMDLTFEQYARATGRDGLADRLAAQQDTTTRREFYSVFYSKYSNPGDYMNEEAVAHLVTLAHAGSLTRRAMDQIGPDLEALFAQGMRAREGGTWLTTRPEVDNSIMGGIGGRHGMGGRGPIITFNASDELPNALKRIPKWDDIQARLPKDADGHPDVEHLQTRMRELFGKGGWGELTVPEKVQIYRELGGDITARQGYQGPPLSPDEIDSLVDMWRYSQEVRGRDAPESLATWVRSQGGIADHAGEVRHMMGGPKARPGLVNNRNGGNLDDLALRAWENGFFPQHVERPSITEFLDTLRDDLHAGRTVRAHHSEHFDDVRVADEMAEELATYGIVGRHFKSEQNVREHFAGRPVTERASRLGAGAADESGEGPRSVAPYPGAQGRPGEAGQVAGSLQDRLAGVNADVPPGWDMPTAGGGGSGPPPIPPGGGMGGRGGPPPVPPSGGPPPLPERFSREFDFNWERWQTGDDVKRAAGMMIDANRQLMVEHGVSGGGRGYVQTHAMTEAMAREKDGLRLLFEEGARSGRIFDAAETRALSTLKVSAWEEFRRLAEVAADPNSGPMDFARMRHLGQLSLLITAEIKGSVSEAARSMNILQRAAVSSEKYKAQLDAIIRQAGGEDHNRALAQSIVDIMNGPNGGVRADAFIEKGLAAKTIDAIIELRAGNLLTGPITWIRNITSNAFAIPYQILVRHVAGHIGELLHHGDGVKLGEAMQMAGAMRGHWREAFSALGESFVTGESRMGLTGANTGQMTGRSSRLGAEAWGVKTPDAWRTATARPWGDKTAPPEAMPPNDLRRFKALADPQLYREVMAEPQTMLGLGMDMLANAHQAISFRPTGSTDPLFKVLNRQAQLAAVAMRRAEHELIRGEITQAELKDRVLELRKNPTEEMRLEADEFANYNTFTDQMGKFGQWIESGRQSESAPVRLVTNLLLPFHRTPNRLFAYAFENSPIALITSRFYAEMSAGGARADLALAKLGVGTMGLTLGMDLFLDGWITGSSPKRRAERETYERGGFREYALRMPSGKNPDGSPQFTYLPINNIGGAADVFLWGAMFGDTALRLSQQPNTDWHENWDRAFAGATFAVADMMMNKSVLQGVGNFMKAVVQPEGRSQNFVEQMTQSFVPASSGLRYARRVGVPGGADADPIRRHVNGMMEAVIDITPGLSVTLPPQLDFWGKEKTRQSGLGPWYDAMSPFFPTTTNEDAQPIDREFVRLNYFPEHPLSVPMLRSQAAAAALERSTRSRPRRPEHERGIGILDGVLGDPADARTSESNMVALRDFPLVRNRIAILAGGTPASALLKENEDHLIAANRAAVARSLDQYGNKTLQQVLNELVQDQRYHSPDLTDEMRLQSIKDVIRDYQTAARAQVIREFPEIQERRDRMPTREEQAKRSPF